MQLLWFAAPTMDVDWGSGTSFATCSSDKRIFVCKVGDTEPTRCLEGHTDEVNNVKWDPSGSHPPSLGFPLTERLYSSFLFFRLISLTCLACLVSTVKLS